LPTNNKEVKIVGAISRVTQTPAVIGGTPSPLAQRYKIFDLGTGPLFFANIRIKQKLVIT